MQNLEEKINSLLDQSFKNKISNLRLSIELSLKALSLCKDTKLDHLKARAQSQLSLYYVIIGKYDESFNLSQNSIQLYENLEDELGIAHEKYNLSGFYFRTDSLHLSVVNLIDALLIYRRFNDFYNISRCEKLLGSIYHCIDDEPKALESYVRAIKAAKDANDLDLESNVMINLSAIHLKNGEIDMAEEIISRAIEIKQNSNDIRGLSFAIYGRGKIHLALKNYEKAESDFLQALSTHLEVGDKFGLAITYNKLAVLYFEQDKIDLAEKMLNAGLEICNLYSNSIIKIKLFHLSYLLSKSKDNATEALQQLEHHIKLKELIFNTQNLKIAENYDLLIKIQSMQKETESQHEKTKLIAKNSKIKEQSRVRQEFLSNMSHEIRTPLNAITTISRILSDSSDIEDKTLIDSLQFSSNHLMQIINDILDFTQLDLGKMTLDIHPCIFKPFLERFWNTYEIQTREKNVDFILNIDPHLSDCYLIDETKITQVLGNLVNNAIKFTDSGNITLEVRLVEKGKESDMVAFSVTDTGIGIAAENFGKIFEHFSQLKSGITRKKDGSGLGLSITKKIVELLNSQIKIESVLGQGTCFSFTLELEKSTAVISPDKISPVNSDRRIKVLLAEDNAINALMAIKLLSNWGIETDHAKNGLEATEKAKQEKYDYILMDIHMPVLDGYQAALNIKTFDNINQCTPIFALTADIAAVDNNDYKIYFDSFFLKPLEIDKLKMALNP